jgi:hypothetical protein
MPNDPAVYRKSADECRREAERASNEPDKKHWLRIAEAWTSACPIE